MLTHPSDPVLHQAKLAWHPLTLTPRPPWGLSRPSPENRLSGMERRELSPAQKQVAADLQAAVAGTSRDKGRKHVVHTCHKFCTRTHLKLGLNCLNLKPYTIKPKP
jgi:hypothetical protein